jgi:hypothetical protein
VKVLPLVDSLIKYCSEEKNEQKEEGRPPQRLERENIFES